MTTQPMTPTTETPESRHTPGLKAKHGRIQLGARTFHVVEEREGRWFGPWAIVENNGDGKGVVAVIREGIEGSRNHAIKFMEKIISELPEARALLVRAGGTK